LSLGSIVSAPLTSTDSPSASISNEPVSPVVTTLQATQVQTSNQRTWAGQKRPSAKDGNEPQAKVSFQICFQVKL